MTQDNGLDAPPWEDKPQVNPDLLFCFDLETTGKYPETAMPVQICLISEEGNQRRILMNQFVNPGMAIPAEASNVHHITDDKVAYAPDVVMSAWIAHNLCHGMKPKYLVGYNSLTYDEPIIDRCLGAKVFENTIHLDVLNVAYRLLPELPSHKLGDIYRHLTGHELTGAHDASVDVIGTLEILRLLRVKAGMTLPRLGEYMETPQIYPIMPIGKYKGKTPQDVQISWANWMLKNATNMRPDLQLTVEYIANGCRPLA